MNSDHRILPLSHVTLTLISIQPPNHPTEQVSRIVSTPTKVLAPVRYIFFFNLQSDRHLVSGHSTSVTSTAQQWGGGAAQKEKRRAQLETGLAEVEQDLCRAAWLRTKKQSGCDGGKTGQLLGWIQCGLEGRDCCNTRLLSAHRKGAVWHLSRGQIGTVSNHPFLCILFGWAMLRGCVKAPFPGADSPRSIYSDFFIMGGPGTGQGST